MALGRINIRDIRKADKMVRAFVRQWMALPNNISIGYFHAPVSEGGRGIPSLRWLAPFHCKDRLLGLVHGRRMENIADPYLAKEIGQCRQRLTENGSTYNTYEEIKKRWAVILHQSIDGSSLKNSHQVTGQHQWVADGTSLLSSRNYINCHKVRIGALPTRSRTTRRRRGDRLCHAGCMALETKNHVLQICPRAHKARIDRHDAVLSYLGRNLRRQGFEVQATVH